MSNNPSAYPDVMNPHGLGNLSFGADGTPPLPLGEGIAEVALALAVILAASRPA